MDATALVTGGTGGLGAAVTAELLDSGWRVVVPWVEPSKLERVGRRDGLELVEADLFDPGAARAAVEHAARDAHVPLRAVVNLVGGYAGGAKVADTPVEDFEQQLRLNLRPTYLVTQAALPHLVEAGGGAVVCVSSRAAVRPFPGAAGYVTAKAAVLAFAQAVAAEYKADGVRCNAILPSVIDTPANRAAQPGADHAKWVPPERVAALIRFLCSDESAATSSAAIPVYGRA
ncbi:MAG TPA: SDR family NAD(P)-dependent oxidoreductase [Actinomycetota bacterium]|nr:SDR family NAD(P)-dependent oxidoreductase [Actinomycetota bacterium]